MCGENHSNDVIGGLMPNINKCPRTNDAMNVPPSLKESKRDNQQPQQPQQEQKSEWFPTESINSKC